MEDKNFELLTKMYGEFSEFRKEITQKVDQNSNEIKKVQIKLEHDMEPKIKALYEDREIVHEKLDTMESKIKVLYEDREIIHEKLDTIERKIDCHDECILKKVK